jgi:hypothetical protein
MRNLIPQYDLSKAISQVNHDADTNAVYLLLSFREMGWRNTAGNSRIRLTMTIVGTKSIHNVTVLNIMADY